MSYHSNYGETDEQNSESGGEPDPQLDSPPDRSSDESSEAGSPADQSTGQHGHLALSRRSALATLVGLGGLSLASGTASGKKVKTWKKDRDAGGNDLFNLGTLVMLDNPTGIRDFEGANLAIDGNNVLNADQWNKDVDAGGNDLSALGSVSASEVNTDALSDNGAGEVTLLTGIDAGGNDLFDLGGLRLRGKSILITDFEGTGLSVDENGVLNAQGTPWEDTDGDSLLEASGADGIDVGRAKAGSVEETLMLPDYTTVGDDPSAVIDAMERLFHTPDWISDLPAGWTKGTYRRKTAPEEAINTFGRPVALPDGQIIFSPWNSDHVGVYDPSTDTYISGPSHGEDSTPNFNGGALAPTGDVIFAPVDSDHVGVYDPKARTYRSGDSHDTDGFFGAVLAPTGNVVFAPLGSDVVGEYEPATDTFLAPASHGEGRGAFGGAALAPTGDIIFAPSDSDNVGIYDPEKGRYTSGASHNEGDAAFNGAVLAPSGDVIFVPAVSEHVGVYDPESDTYMSGDTVDVDFDFAGGALTPTGEVVFAPFDNRTIGLYDPATDTFTAGPTHGELRSAFRGAALAPTGEVIFSPWVSERVGSFAKFEGTTLRRGNVAHPLVNNT